MIKKRKSTKYVFTLKNVNTDTADKKYNIGPVSNIADPVADTENVTQISEISDIAKTPSTISFLDESKRIYKCNISMIDIKTATNLNSMKRCHCFWDRNPFNSMPIGCPVNYITNSIIKEYFSEISRDNYVIKEDITEKRTKMYTRDKTSFYTLPQNVTISADSYYETDGIFCSFNCLRAYIKHNKHNKLYDRSEFLMNKLYRECTGNGNFVINEAPHWRTLEEYGGNKTINEFRDGFNKLNNEQHGIIRKINFRPIGHLYEEKFNF